MRYLYAIFLTILLLYWSQSVLCQEVKVTDWNVDNITFIKFANSLEISYGCHLFFDSTELSDFQITLSVKQVSLNQILERVFNKTQFHLYA